jgi:glutamine synthetase
VAHRHKLKVLFHEKPFKGVNGSGKHCNWSMTTDSGINLLEPTANPEKNLPFLIFLLATLKALQDHGDLLRAGIASASNDHRLGAHEAPPGIISAFLGDHLTEVLNSIEEDRPLKAFSSPEMQSVRVGGTVLDLKVATLPNIARDLTDRNRTSPFAFTGNKFEFRAVGSKQSVSFPVTLLNSAVASALEEVAKELEKQKGDKQYASEQDQIAVIKHFIKLTKDVRFEGDNYSDAWVKEAEKRGLPNINNSYDAFSRLREARNADMLEKVGVFSKEELESRYHILMEKYAKDVRIEAQTLHTMVVQQILPAAFAYRKELAEGASMLKAVDAGAEPEIKVLKTLTPILTNLQNAITDLEKQIIASDDITDDIGALGKQSQASLLPAIENVRAYADDLESIVGDKFWPLPKYTELFLNI